eukprot:3569754-Alexandrium_andersonii.AAC.1
MPDGPLTARRNPRTEHTRHLGEKRAARAPPKVKPQPWRRSRKGPLRHACLQVFNIAGATAARLPFCGRPARAPRMRRKRQ